MKRALLTAAMLGILATTAPLASARKWTSSDGQYAVEAELVEIADGKVHLKKPEGDDGRSSGGTSQRSRPPFPHHVEEDGRQLR